MARIELAPEVLDDFIRIIAHLKRFDVAGASARVDQIIESFEILRHSPLIGRQVKGGKRELVIGRGAHGYVAQYRFVPGLDTVFVLALRAQRESGFARRK